MILSEAIDAVGRMITGYPNGGAAAGASYIGTIASLLCQYPRMVATECADPLRGVARTTKFLPTVAEVVAWCEPHTDRMGRTVDYDERSLRQLQERRELIARAQAETPEYRKAVVDRIMGELAKHGLTKDKLLAHGETPATVRAKHGISQEQWDTMPNAPPPGQWEKLRANHMETPRPPARANTTGGP